MELGLTDKGALEISNNMFEIVKRNTDFNEKQILGYFISIAMNEEQKFFEIIKVSLLNIGLELMREEA